jgi:hypothetical protein
MGAQSQQIAHNDCTLFTIGNLAPFQGGSPGVSPGLKPQAQSCCPFGTKARPPFLLEASLFLLITTGWKSLFPPEKSSASLS